MLVPQQPVRARLHAGSRSRRFRPRRATGSRSRAARKARARLPPLPGRPGQRASGSRRGATLVVARRAPRASRCPETESGSSRPPPARCNRRPAARAGCAAAVRTAAEVKFSRSALSVHINTYSYIKKSALKIFLLADARIPQASDCLNLH